MFAHWSPCMYESPQALHEHIVNSRLRQLAGKVQDQEQGASSQRARALRQSVGSLVSK